MSSEQEIKALFAKYNDGNISKEAFDELMLHLKREENNAHAEAAMDLLWNNMSDNEPYSLVEQEAAYKRLIANTNFKNKKPVKLWPKLIAAAVVLLVMSVGLWLYTHQPETGVSLAKSTEKISPGKDRAILTLADGKVIDLAAAVNGKSQRYGNVLISKNAKGSLVYTLASTAPIQGEAITYNTISTPKGGQIQVDLPDGTKVWLNAASKITIPSTFNFSNERQIELVGEAYFEVFHDADKPFLVKSNNQTVEVLGTHFNINAYPDEMQTKTTLVEGAVKVNNANLTPGKQSIITANSIKIVNANIEMETAWKNGEFNFEGQDFRTLMRAISRWYDVEVVYEYDVPKDLRIGAQISRNRNLSEILDRLELTREVKFKVEGRRISVIK